MSTDTVQVTNVTRVEYTSHATLYYSEVEVHTRTVHCMYSTYIVHKHVKFTFDRIPISNSYCVSHT